MAKVIKNNTSKPLDLTQSIEVKSLGSKLKNNKKYILIIAVVAIVALTPSVYLYNQYQSTKNLLQNPKEQVSQDTKSLVESVGKLIELPTNEQPRLATVTDVTQLVGQTFFAKAKNGDRVLIYTQAGKAILYRPGQNKIIEVAPVNANINSQAQNNTIAPTNAPQEKPVTVTVLNGTLTAGLAKTAESNIKSSLKNVTSVATADALSGQYEGTIVVDVSGASAEATKQIAELLGGKVETVVPTGEKQPTTDILVILGSDYVK